MNLRAILFIALGLAPLFCSCEQRAQPTAEGPSSVPFPAKIATSRAPRLIVSVAASTTEAVEALCSRFSEDYNIEVRINSGPSSSLAAQILHGAPADIFLSANAAWADEIVRAGKAEEFQPILNNRLVLVAPQGNPADLARPEDLLSERVVNVALAGEKVPAGIYGEQALRGLGIFDPLVENGKIVRAQDVRSALSFVERGEAEAGIVYATDLRVAPAVTLVHEFDESLHEKIVYVLVRLRSVSAEGHAQKLYEFLRSASAMAVYEEDGFTPLDQPTLEATLPLP